MIKPPSNSLRRTNSDVEPASLLRPPLPPSKQDVVRSVSFNNDKPKLRNLSEMTRKSFHFYKKKLGQALESASSKTSSMSSLSSTGSTGNVVVVKMSETPAPMPPAVLVNLPGRSPKRKSSSPVPSPASSSPKLFQKTDKTCNVPAALILGNGADLSRIKTPPSPVRPPRKKSPSKVRETIFRIRIF